MRGCLLLMREPLLARDDAIAVRVHRSVELRHFASAGAALHEVRKLVDVYSATAVAIGAIECCMRSLSHRR